MLRSLIQSLDFNALQWAASAAASYPWLNALTYVCAQFLVYVFPLALVALWMRPEAVGKHHGAQKAVVIAVFAMVIALAVKSGVNFFWVRDRPYTSHPGLVHLDLHAEPISFPSGHTLLAFAIASSIWLSGFRRFGGVLLVLAILVGLGRIFAGVHYPSDVIAGAMIACAISLVLHRESSSLKRYLPNR